jgi:hypothetical protein
MKWSSVESGTDGQQRSSVMVDADDATEAALTTERICLPPKNGLDEGGILLGPNCDL